MIIATYVKFGNDRHYFQTNKDLFKKIKSSLFNQFRKDVDFLIDLLATNGEHSVNYENYLEEKELLFKAMLNNEAFEEVPSTKRGHKPGEMERIVDQAVRVSTNVKNRQTKAQDASMEFLEQKIGKDNLLSHKILLFTQIFRI